MERLFLRHEMLVWGKEVFRVPVIGLKDRVGQVADWFCENAPLLWTWSAPEAKSKGDYCQFLFGEVRAGLQCSFGIQVASSEGGLEVDLGGKYSLVRELSSSSNIPVYHPE